MRKKEVGEEEEEALPLIACNANIPTLPMQKLGK